MALLDDTSEARTERPTERRRRQARERGEVARSVELLTAARLLAIWIVIAWWFAKFVATATSSLRATFENAGSIALPPTTALLHLRDLAWQFLASASWPLAAATIAILIAHFSQVGWLWNWENSSPQWSRLSPLTGFHRMFSLATIGLALGLTLKLVVVVGTSSIVLSRFSPVSSSAGNASQLARLESSALQLVAFAALAMLIFGAMHYAWQRWRFERSLFMTREELREELKELEGDPRQKRHRQATSHHLPNASMPTRSNADSTS